MIDFECFRQKLLTLRRNLLEVEASGNESAGTVELDQSKVGRLSRIDALQNQALAKGTRQRRTIQKHRIDSALSRLENGTYGLCVGCEEAIDLKRMEFDPSIPLCLDCAQRREG